ncbi:hypothetical protein NS365_01910 [Aureimonas ureilytica]|uniref:Uncharacterized protein n=1 Tax=Aureimonas ureilytica TaxID=401562 RepID=A0A175RWX2_9HYPH|nr:hypothetical protein NS365_01910 [Aureimonas ureilytica]
MTLRSSAANEACVLQRVFDSALRAAARGALHGHDATATGEPDRLVSIQRRVVMRPILCPFAQALPVSLRTGWVPPAGLRFAKRHSS